MPDMVAALFVQEGGPYFGLPGVEPWGITADARLYPGPWPVVAHPPCQRWGRYWAGSPSVIAHTGVRKKLGDDDGCFASALHSVRRWGGVLEHPADTHAWHAFGLNAPPPGGGWAPADGAGRGKEHGWTCEVEQGCYGHLARKRTWLYTVGTDLHPLRWGTSSMGKPSQAEDSVRARGRRTANDAIERMSLRQREATPTAFRDELLSLARSVR